MEETKAKSGMKAREVEIDDANGISIAGSVTLGVDTYSIRTLYESGMRILDISNEFKITQRHVKQLAKDGNWLRPAAVERMRKDIEKKQAQLYKSTGKTRDVSLIKAEVWKERSEAIKEKTYGIISSALEGVTPEKAKHFIKNPLGLLNTLNAARLITGEEDAANNQPALAVNIGFLRSNKPTPVVVDVESSTEHSES